MLALGVVFPAATGLTQFAHFVTRTADKLYDGEQQVRFISFNTPNLHYIEDYLPVEGTNAWRFPDEFEIRDALTSIKQLGGKVTRMYVLSVRRQDDAPGIARHVEGPGQFNEEAFKALDKVLQVANEVGVRVIIPFVDNWHWWGGPREYAGFRGKPKEAFWTDPEVIADLKATIRFTINRKNTFTGTAYRDDKAILAWETGNELDAPFSWTREIAAYVKSQDTNHMLAEGTNVRVLTGEALDDPNLDILTTHHYGNPQESIGLIVKNQEMARGRKPYVIGEFGIVPLQDIRAIVDTIINQGLTGGMIWSLRYRNREGGFYCHNEYNNVQSYHWPGFDNGNFYNERLVVSFIRDRAYRIDGSTPPRLEVPGAPVMLDTPDPSRIAWHGSTGAESYRLERREDGMDAWQVIGEAVDESRVQYKPLFSDETIEPGKKYYYRAKARNETGGSEWSNVLGPVVASSRVFVDELEDFGRVFQKDGALRILVSEDIRKAKEDRSRLTGGDGSYIIYKMPAPASAIHVEWLKAGADAGVAVRTAPDVREFSDAQATDRMFVSGKNDYGFYDAVVSTVNTPAPGTLFVQILIRGGAQIGRVEITY
jgi:hypothetical protein